MSSSDRLEPMCRSTTTLRFDRSLSCFKYIDSLVLLWNSISMSISAHGFRAVNLEPFAKLTNTTSFSAFLFIKNKFNNKCIIYRRLWKQPGLDVWNFSPFVAKLNFTNPIVRQVIHKGSIDKMFLRWFLNCELFFQDFLVFSVNSKQSFVQNICMCVCVCVCEIVCIIRRACDF